MSIEKPAQPEPAEMEREHEPLLDLPRQRMEIDVSVGALVKIIGVFLVLWLVVRLWTVIVLIAVSLMLVATFTPVVRTLQTRISRRWALATVIIGIFAAIAMIIWLIVPIVLAQGANLISQLPTYAHNLQEMLVKRGFRVDLRQGTERVVQAVASGLPQLVSILSNVMEWIFNSVTVLVLTVYLLIEGPEVGRSALRLFPKSQRGPILRLGADVGMQVGRYVRGQLMLSLMAGTFFLILLICFGITDAVALALIAALADALPIIGLLIALVPVGLTALATTSAWTAGLIVTFYLLYHQVEVNYIAPRIFGKELGMSVSAIVIAITVGMELMGVTGALLALPIAAAMPSITRYVASLHDPGDTSGD